MESLEEIQRLRRLSSYVAPRRYGEVPFEIALRSL